LCAQFTEERFKRRFVCFGDDVDAIVSVENPSGDAVRPGRAIDERAETDALDDAGYTKSNRSPRSSLTRR
jgi:hypothetical protein